MKAHWLVNAAMIVALVSPTVFAADKEEMKRMQQQLNQEVMAKEFFAEEPEKVDAYIKEAMKKDLKPVEYEGTNWRRG